MTKHDFSLRLITPERLLEENEALRQIIREALRFTSYENLSAAEEHELVELETRMRAAIGEEKA